MPNASRPGRSFASHRWPALVLALVTGCGSHDAPPPPTPSAAPGATAAPSGATTASPGAPLLTTDGELAQGELRAGRGYVARQHVQVAAGDRIRVSLTSSAFDPVLEVTTPDGITLSNDDARGDRTRSELEFVVAHGGDLKVGVTSYQAGATGAYHLEIARTQAPSAPARAAVAAATTQHHRFFTNFLGTGSPTPAAAGAAPAAAPTVAPLRLGDRVQANLAAGDATLPSGELADAYELNVTEAGPITIQMQSTNVDSFLVVRTPSGEELRNDDSGGSRDAQVDLDAVPGTYRIVATTYRAGETGAYELKALSSRGGAPTATATAPSAAAATRTEHGELAQGDSQLRSGEFYDETTLDLAVGQAVHIEARSTAFDTYLIVRAPSGAQEDNDDLTPGNLNAGLDFVAREAGPHRVLVTSYRPGESGAYDLVIGGTGAAGTAPTPTPAVTPVPGNGAAPAAAPTAGGAQRGELAQGDSQLRSGEFTDTYPMQFTPGQPVSIRVESSAFDTYLIVRSPSGRQEDNDDLTPGNTNSGVDIPAAEAGTYQVVVTSYQPGETGAYTLTSGASSASGGGAGGTIGGGAGGGTTGSGTTGPSARPGSSSTRVWTVSVGISDYPGGGNDLPECANDAVKIAEALRNQGLTAPEREILLTDAQATRSNIRNALQRVAREAQPDDVFVFFYSGHGGQADTPSQDREELDGIDEYLYVYDGEFMDDEMGQLIRGIRARTTLFALDACFSGGFAKDVVTRPGIVGLFSSEEDVTSGVASQFQAGGYLSHFLRLGIQGEADDDPRDGALTVGELTHYVWQQYGRQASDVRMQEGYQQLVIDRGAVRTTQVLWSIQR